MLKGKCLIAAKKALKEGRLFFRCADQYGRSCNGGDRSFRLDRPKNNMPGKWAPKIKNPSICSRGYHGTMDPIRWAGVTVELIEVDRVAEKHTVGDTKVIEKVVALSMRCLAVLDPDEIIDPRIWVVANRPIMRGADLRGADLRGAYATKYTNWPDGFDPQAAGVKVS